jgi:hypothetical protein
MYYIYMCTMPPDPGVVTFPQQPVPRDGRLRSNLCSVSETQLNFKTICKHLRPTAGGGGRIPSTTNLTSIFVSKPRVCERSRARGCVLYYITRRTKKKKKSNIKHKKWKNKKPSSPSLRIYIYILYTYSELGIIYTSERGPTGNVFSRQWVLCTQLQ